jgi:Leucine-rich repeat (LRR) protein/GTPase SAR1 family protein
MPKDKAYKQAEQKIADALRSGATELNLRSMKLTELPESIGQLKQLQKLDLGLGGYFESAEEDKNRLTTLPDSLGQLTQLTELDLSNNQLTALPDSLGRLSSLTQLTSLDLSHNQLTALPDSLGRLSSLTQLTSLNLSHNQLTALPDSLGHLTQLTSLVLSHNQLTALPDSLGHLTQLTSLDLSNNQLTTLPDSLGHLTQLTELDLSSNQLTTLPEALRQLTRLQTLDLSRNQQLRLPKWLGKLSDWKSLDASNAVDDARHWLDGLVLAGSQVPFLGIWFNEIPNWLNNLNNLQWIRLDNRELIDLPAWIYNNTQLRCLGISNNNINDLSPSFAQLEHLENLDLDDNPLNPALQSAYDNRSSGYLDRVKAYLRSLAEGNAEPLYEAKLVLVGEGNVGKTTLLKALKGPKTEDGGPRQGETTTHGVAIDIAGLRLPHPEKENVEIQLNAWDFGGQDVYRVTHQFFFSRRSLYLLVWEPRRGVQQGQVEDWLNMIRLRVGDEARVLIVSTHCKTGERIARIDQPVLQAQYGALIVGFYEVDSLVPDEATGEMVGIAELKKVIARESAKLEQMGMMFNRDWKAARDELIALPEPRISFSTFSGICAARGLSQLDADTLAHLMHDLGYIVHYSDDEKLRDDVVLKPEWLTKAIGFVLENRATAEREGILPDSDLHTVWHDHAFPNEPRYDSTLYPFFLRLMEKYDVCYRLTDGKASLVAQHVPQIRPELPWLPEQEPPKDQRRIAMVCALEEDPPGLVPWMIVRTHDYSHHLHWQKGMFLSHGTHGTAMLEKRGREFHVYSQGQWPEYLMNILQNTLEKLITDNWPGLKDRYRFMVPCPEVIKGESCKGRFNIHALRQFLAEGDTTVRCQECSCKISITELLMGFEKRSPEELLQEMRQEMNARFDGVESLAAYYFMSTLHAIADEGKNGPRLFTLSSGYAESSLEKLLSHPMELQLWCEAEGCQHPLYDYGLYKIDSPKEWVKQTAHYAILAFKLLNIISPIAAPAINTFFGSKTTEKWGIDDRLKLAGAIIGKLPTKIETPDQRLPQRDMLNEVERSGILALHRFLNEVDPTGAKLGLHRVATYTGDYRWLCKHHYDAWQPNIPDVIR